MLSNVECAILFVAGYGAYHIVKDLFNLFRVLFQSI